MEVLRLWYSNAEKEQRNSMTGLTFLLYVSQNHFCQALYEFNWSELHWCFEWLDFSLWKHHCSGTESLQWQRVVIEFLILRALAECLTVRADICMGSTSLLVVCWVSQALARLHISCLIKYWGWHSGLGICCFTGLWNQTQYRKRDRGSCIEWERERHLVQVSQTSWQW